MLLTCLWYIREVDPATLLLTGLTRDGVYLVENGEIVGAVNNFRFNESPVDLLAKSDRGGPNRTGPVEGVERVLQPHGHAADSRRGVQHELGEPGHLADVRQTGQGSIRRGLRFRPRTVAEPARASWSRGDPLTALPCDDVSWIRLHAFNKEDPVVTDHVELTLPARPDLLVLARMTVGAVAARAEMAVDDIEDLRLRSTSCACLPSGTSGTGASSCATTGGRLEWRSPAPSGPRITVPSQDSDESRDHRARSLPTDLSERILDALVDEHGRDEVEGGERAWFRKRHERADG